MTEFNLDERMVRRLSEAADRLSQVDAELADPEVASNPERLRSLGQERAELDPLVRASEKLDGLRRAWESARELVAETDDPEMLAMAEEEMESLQASADTLSVEIRDLLIPKDPLEDRPAVVEIRAGTGGDEAGLFAGDLFRMYRRSAERNGWSLEVISLSEGIPGSIKEVIFTLREGGSTDASGLNPGSTGCKECPRPKAREGSIPPRPRWPSSRRLRKST